MELESHEIPKYGECLWKSHKQSRKEPMMFDILAQRCGEGDRDHAVITTVLLIDDRDISLEPCVLLLRYDHVHLDGHWSLCRGEVLTGSTEKTSTSPMSGYCSESSSAASRYPRCSSPGNCHARSPLV